MVKQFITSVAKVCARCCQEKGISDFHAKKSHSSGYNSVCKDCINANTRSRYTPVPESQATIESRFWDKVEKTEGCWIWKGSVKPNGYGKAYIGSKGAGIKSRSIHEYAHRFSFQLANGFLPKGRKEVICHACDNPLCVNPSHLFLASQKENIADMYGKGRRTHKRGCDGKFISETEE